MKKIMKQGTLNIRYERKIIITRNTAMFGKKELVIDSASRREDYDLMDDIENWWCGKGYVQDIPGLSVQEREFLISGMSLEEQAVMFAAPEER